MALTGIQAGHLHNSALCSRKSTRELQPDLDEASFVDANARALREGRFLLLTTGDGIREGISSMAELITRNAALGFSFGFVEWLSMNSASRAWWEPLTRIGFDYPEQEAPSYRTRNHVRVPLPYPGIWITGFRSTADGSCGVFLIGKKSELPKVLDRLNEEREQILSELSNPLSERTQMDPARPGFASYTSMAEFSSPDDCRAWLAQQMNDFINVFERG